MRRATGRGSQTVEAAALKAAVEEGLAWSSTAGTRAMGAGRGRRGRHASRAGPAGDFRSRCRIWILLSIQ